LPPARRQPIPRRITALPKPAPVAPAAPIATLPPPKYGRIVECCWPIGQPDTRSFRFCDIPSVPGRSYCEEHTKLAYRKVRDRREDAYDKAA
jgi:GcrA cell cycle regulator